MARSLCGVFINTALLLILASAHAADQVYQEPEEFLREAFAGETPEPQVLWLTGELRQQAKTILSHDPQALRVRYWTRERRSAWILEEIGKDKPITVGIVVEGRQIKGLRVLIFRESRGWEVRHPFFTDQFKDTGLTEALELDHPIDGVTGATLSVRALTRLARLALLLAQHTGPTP